MCMTYDDVRQARRRTIATFEEANIDVRVGEEATMILLQYSLFIGLVCSPVDTTRACASFTHLIEKKGRISCWPLHSKTQ